VSIWPQLNGHHFSGNYSLELPADYYHSHVFGRTTIGAKMALTYPDDIEVSASYTHHHSGDVWRYEQLFMAGEQLICRWKKKSSNPFSQ
jgi:hypothetical protein